MFVQSPGPFPQFRNPGYRLLTHLCLWSEYFYVQQLFFLSFSSLVAGRAWCSPCQRQHQDVTRYREQCGRVNSEPEHPCSMRYTAPEAETLCLVSLPNNRERGAGRSCFPWNPALLPLSTPSHPKVKGRGVLAAEESSPCQSKECSV